MNPNLLIELKSEYTSHLENILTPVILEGLESIYKTVKNNTEDKSILKTFQKCLQSIPKWNEARLTKEYSRIKKRTLKTPWLVDLVKAIIKTNVKILALKDISPEDYQDINMLNFIHLVYIQCAREFWNDPFLFYHDYSALDIKRNNKEIISLINKSIRIAIRKILPMNIILEKYLGEDKSNDKDFDFSANMENNEKINIPLLLEKNLQSEVNLFEKEVNNQPLKNPLNTIPEQNGGNVNEEILKIINNQDIELSESFSSKRSNNNHSTEKRNRTSDHKKSNRSSRFSKSENSSRSKNSSSTLKNIINESINKKTSESKSISINSKVKNDLKKDLAESESLTYNPEDNNKKYQDIFSNSEVESKKNNSNETIDTINLKKTKSKEKFFNNYLNI